MAETGQDKVNAGTAPTELCPVPMQDGKPCGRCSLGTLVDGVPYCLMHTPLGKDNAAFQEEFQRTLEEAGTDVADFTRCVFPAANYNNKQFAAKCVFNEAKFTQGADFIGATFAQSADFRRAMFTQVADFGQVTFETDADFFGARFAQSTDFRGTTFMQNADFREATFTGDADFRWAMFTQNADPRRDAFTQKADFFGATFTQNADFSGAKFTQNAQFSQATFTQNARFGQATFTQNADFSGAKFTQNAQFGQAKFTQNAQFGQAKFTQNALFFGTAFTQNADFRSAKFLGAAEFRETVFRRDNEIVPGPVFSWAEFFQPEKVVFYKTYLGQALLHNCDVSKLVFSSVGWRQRRPLGKRMVFEEIVDLNNIAADALRPKEVSLDELDYDLIAELYQQLKKNYDDKKDYWTAGDFHYGEMEMKRLASRRKKQALRWLHRNLGLVAWYKYASQYGESYLRPALWLLGVLLFFACLYPLVGLQYEPARDRPKAKSALAVPTPQPANRPPNTTAAQSADAVVLTYSLPFRPGEDSRGGWWRARLRLAWHSMWVGVFVALFQKEFVYEPVYLWGRVLAVLEQTLVSTLFALFILAVRRQFRR